MSADDEPDLGDIALAVGLSYIDFRLPESGWRTIAPQVVKWLERIAVRSLLRLTAPE